MLSINNYSDKQDIKRYCFFDIDGVLNTENDWKVQNYSINKTLFLNFCTFIKKNNLQPVIISSWRTGFIDSGNEKNTPQIKMLENMFLEQEIILKYKTPTIKGKRRDDEINRFLYYHDTDIYIILDDDLSEYRKISNHNYFVSSSHGFSKKDIIKCSKYMNSF